MWIQLPLPAEKGHTHPTQFLAHVYCGQMAGWMKTPFGTEVDLGPGDIVLDGVPATAKGARIAAPLFSAHVYCGHGRPSQLLLSSCTNGRPKPAEPIDLSLGLWAGVSRRKHKLHRILQAAPICPYGRAHWCHLANTIEPSFCGGDAVVNLLWTIYWLLISPQR